MIGDLIVRIVKTLKNNLKFGGIDRCKSLWICYQHYVSKIFHTLPGTEKQASGLRWWLKVIVMIRNLELLSQGSQAAICSGLLRMGRVGLDGLSYSVGLKYVYSGDLWLPLLCLETNLVCAVRFWIHHGNRCKNKPEIKDTYNVSKVGSNVHLCAFVSLFPIKAF